jgi:hypothetical protein
MGITKYNTDSPILKAPAIWNYSTLKKVLSRGPLLVCIGSRQPSDGAWCDGKVLASVLMAAGKPLRVVRGI